MTTHEGFPNSPNSSRLQSPDRSSRRSVSPQSRLSSAVSKGQVIPSYQLRLIIKEAFWKFCALDLEEFEVSALEKQIYG